MVPPYERIPVDYQKYPAYTQEPMTLAEKVPHKKQRSNIEEEPVAQPTQAPTPKVSPNMTGMEEKQASTHTPQYVAINKEDGKTISDCTKNCTDTCIAKDGLTIKSMIACLKSCKCGQPAAEQLLKSRAGYIINRCKNGR